MTPSDMKHLLMVQGYSEFSANIITSQWQEFPNDRTKWGTEERTKETVEFILANYQATL